MGRSKTIGVELQKLIVQEVQRGFTHRDVATRFGVSKAGVTGIMKRFKERGDVVINKNSGRPRVTTDRVVEKK